MKAFWLLWGFDTIIALVVVYFFCLGLVDGSVSSFNMGLWLLMLLGVGIVVLGSLALRWRGRVRSATGLLLTLALPGLVAVLFLGAVLVTQPRWN